ncbi:MAG: hypothetical protein WAU78_07835 [Roseiarcus sp.]
MSFQNPLPPGIRQVVPDYVSDGVTLAWGFPFRLWAAADLSVFVSSNAGATWTELNNGADYTVAIVGVTAATVNLAAAQPSGNLIRLISARTPSRTTSVVNDGVVQSAPMESELDCVEATMQELRRDVDAISAGAVAAFIAANGGFQFLYQTWLGGLPTAAPSTHGVFWNNAGLAVLS